MDTIATKNGSPFAIAGGTIVPGTLVKANSTTERSVIQGTSGALVVGVASMAQKDPPGLTGSDVAVHAASGDPVDLYGPGDIAPIKASDTITANTLVMSDSVGFAITATGTTAYVAGMALNAASEAGQLVDVWLFPAGSRLGG